MKNKLIAVLSSAFALVFCVNTSVAQAPFKYLTYIFPSDSLQGFDENAAKQEALNRGFFGPEYHVMMYSQKRHFINQKYGYNNGPTMNAKGLTQLLMQLLVSMKILNLLLYYNCWNYWYKFIRLASILGAKPGHQRLLFANRLLSSAG